MFSRVKTRLSQQATTVLTLIYKKSRNCRRWDSDTELF